MSMKTYVQKIYETCSLNGKHWSKAMWELKEIPVLDVWIMSQLHTCRFELPCCRSKIDLIVIFGSISTHSILWGHAKKKPYSDIHNIISFFIFIIIVIFWQIFSFFLVNHRVRAFDFNWALRYRHGVYLNECNRCAQQRDWSIYRIARMSFVFKSNHPNHLRFFEEWKPIELIFFLFSIFDFWNFLFLTDLIFRNEEEKKRLFNKVQFTISFNTSFVDMIIPQSLTQYFARWWYTFSVFYIWIFNWS